MNQQEIQTVANKALVAFNDNRIMVPIDAVEPLSALKNILRQLLVGQLVLAPAPTENSPDAHSISDE